MISIEREITATVYGKPYTMPTFCQECGQDGPVVEWRDSADGSDAHTFCASCLRFWLGELERAGVFDSAASACATLDTAAMVADWWG